MSSDAPLVSTEGKILFLVKTPRRKSFSSYCLEHGCLTFIVLSTRERRVSVLLLVFRKYCQLGQEEDWDRNCPRDGILLVKIRFI